MNLAPLACKIHRAGGVRRFVPTVLACSSALLASSLLGQQPAPQIALNPDGSPGIVSAASQDKVARPPHLPKSIEEIAGGELVSIFGSSYTGGDSCLAAAIPLPTSLCGISVYANGVPIGLLGVFPNQINGAMSDDAVAEVYVERDGVRSESVVVSTVEAAPKFFHDGYGRAIVTDVDFRPVDFANPARPGQTVIFWYTGERGRNGDGDQVPAGNAAAVPDPLLGDVEGQLYRAGPLPELVAGGVSINAAGVDTPGSVGLGQVPITIPTDVSVPEIHIEQGDYFVPVAATERYVGGALTDSYNKRLAGWKLDWVNKTTQAVTSFASTIGGNFIGELPDGDKFTVSYSGVDPASGKQTHYGYTHEFGLEDVVGNQLRGVLPVPILEPNVWSGRTTKEELEFHFRQMDSHVAAPDITKYGPMKFIAAGPGWTEDRIQKIRAAVNIYNEPGQLPLAEFPGMSEEDARARNDINVVYVYVGGTTHAGELRPREFVNGRMSVAEAYISEEGLDADPGDYLIAHEGGHMFIDNDHMEDGSFMHDTVGPWLKERFNETGWQKGTVHQHLIELMRIAGYNRNMKPVDLKLQSAPPAMAVPYTRQGFDSLQEAFIPIIDHNLIELSK